MQHFEYGGGGGKRAEGGEEQTHMPCKSCVTGDVEIQVSWWEVNVCNCIGEERPSSQSSLQTFLPRKSVI